MSMVPNTGKQGDFLDQPHDERDPSPWRALYLDRSTPLNDDVKRAWLVDCSSKSRQFILPIVRPIARTLIILFTILKIISPSSLAFSKALHRLLAWGMQNWIRPEANWLILRHFHLGSQVLAFIGANAPVSGIPSNPLRPARIADIRDELFLKHDLNLFNFVINLNQKLRDEGKELEVVRRPDCSMVEQPDLRIADMPRRWSNVLDLQSAIELFTPLYQLLLTDDDFWRATNSLQLDETIGIYAATILDARMHLGLLNNRHPLVPLSTMKAGHRLVLHGLSTEQLHHYLMMAKAATEEAAEAPDREADPTDATSR